MTFKSISSCSHGIAACIVVLFLSTTQAQRALLQRPVSSGTPEVPSNSSSAPEEANKDVAALIVAWNETLKSEDPKKVAALFAPGAVMLATSSNQLLNTSELIQDYFRDFLKKKPSIQVNEQHLRINSNNSAINSGVLTYTFNSTGERMVTRYTFLYAKTGGKWLIVYYHSSKMPEGGGYMSQLEGEIHATFDKWNDALKSGDPEKVAACYAPDAVLLPTVSDWVRLDHAAIVDYFKHFLKNGPQGTVDVGMVRDLGNHLASYTGIYTFTFNDGTYTQGRFSFTYRKVNDTWLIIDHHSSSLPEPPF